MSTNEETQIVLLLEHVRFSYFYGFEPFIGKNSEGKETRTYSAHAIFDRTHPAFELVRAAQRKVAAAAWGAQAEAVLAQLAAQDKLCMHDGNISKMGQDAYKDKIFVSANNSKPPNIIATRGGQNVVIQRNDPYAPYSGCWGNLMVAVYAQSPNSKPNKWGKRINAQFMGAQFLEHDEKLGGGGRIARPDEFPTVAPADADGAVPAALQSTAASGLV